MDERPHLAVERAAADLKPYLEPTPLQHSQAFTSKAGCHVYLKVESIQPTRAFKVRGALTKLLRMGGEERAAGVITASAGNHGQGVAYAAQAFHVPATVYVPETANTFKVEAIRRNVVDLWQSKLCPSAMGAWYWRKLEECSVGLPTTT